MDKMRSDAISKVCPVVQKTIIIEKYLEETWNQGNSFKSIKGKEKCLELARDPELNGKELRPDMKTFVPL